MGGMEVEVQPLCRYLWYESGAPRAVVDGGLEGGGGDGSGDRRGRIDGGRYSDRGVGGGGGDGDYVDDNY